jgi:hypothetical protein
MTTILETALGTIRRHAMARAGDRVLVAVSGGPDSVALLHVLRELASELPLELAVAHLDHGLRGRASEEDREFVGALAQELGLPFLAEREDVAALARAAKRSLEDAGRAARRRFLRSQPSSSARAGRSRPSPRRSAPRRSSCGSRRERRGGLGIVPVSGIAHPPSDRSREELPTSMRARSATGPMHERGHALPPNRSADAMPLLREQLNPRLADDRADGGVLRDEDRHLDRAARRLPGSAASGGAARPTSSGSCVGIARTAVDADARPVPERRCDGTAPGRRERPSTPPESPDLRADRPDARFRLRPEGDPRRTLRSPFGGRLSAASVRSPGESSTLPPDEDRTPISPPAAD